uniref:Uncharacterized protein n=1 Tax=Ditylenchus dipsaci TaxID=166011 RepID=A0A915ETW2_9BILA
MLASIPVYQSHDRYEVDKCALSSRRLVSHMVSSSASSHVYSPTRVMWEGECGSKSSKLSPKGLLQLSQFPVMKGPVQLPVSTQDLQSTEILSL